MNILGSSEINTNKSFKTICCRLMTNMFRVENKFHHKLICYGQGKETIINCLFLKHSYAHPTILAST